MDLSLPDPNLPISEVVETVLKPLLEDFQYWLGRSQTLLESEPLSFLEPGYQFDLLTRVQKAQMEISAAQGLVHAIQGQAILDLPVVTAWHQLVAECWKVAIQYREQQSNPG